MKAITECHFDIIYHVTIVYYFNDLRYTENISDDVDIFGNTSSILVKGEVACILIIDFWIILNNACSR